jgi:23S rRNA pseudouridine1911/1915/1917 synthase
MTLLDRLRKEFPNAKRQNLKRMVESRRVLINGRPATRLDQPIHDDDQVNVTPNQKPTTPPLPFPIVYEDADVLLINKPAGLLTSTVPREPRATALALVRDYFSGRAPSAKAGLVHRLDRDASGLLIFAKNNRALASLKRQFFHHTVTRVYHAIVTPPPKGERGRIESLLAERADGSVHSTRSRGQRAITEFNVARRHGKFALLRVTLHTGRKHQIRVHLSENGSPIVGDEQYGGVKSRSGLALTAVELAFDHPRSGKRMTFILSARDDPIRAMFIAVGGGGDSL